MPSNSECRTGHSFRSRVVRVPPRLHTSTWIVQAVVWFRVNGYSSLANKAVKITIDKTQEALPQLMIIISDCSSKCCAQSWILPFSVSLHFHLRLWAWPVVSLFDITPNHMFSCFLQSMLIRRDLFCCLARISFRMELMAVEKETNSLGVVWGNVGKTEHFNQWRSCTIWMNYSI